ncbi:MAG: hypothetical protein ABUT39_07405 [Acidobacteriota bacterium]
MWSFDQLRLVLPAGFEHRAAGIARRVAEELAEMPAPGDVSLRSLSLPPIEIRTGATDRQIASQIAGRIARSIAGAASAVHGGSSALNP